MTLADLWLESHAKPCPALRARIQPSTCQALRARPTFTAWTHDKGVFDHHQRAEGTAYFRPAECEGCAGMGESGVVLKTGSKYRKSDPPAGLNKRGKPAKVGITPELAAYLKERRKAKAKAAAKGYQRPIIICGVCGRQRPHKARNLCRTCYNREYDRAKRPCGGNRPKRKNNGTVPWITEAAKAEVKVRVSEVKKKRRQGNGDQS